MSLKNVVLLVDNKQRDLLAVSLIAHHLRARGVTCHLEPLESYRGSLAAYRPDLIIFNHLTASHLAAYSRKLAGMGVLTAVLTNEGITYERDLLKFIVGSHHSDAHIDYFLCWNREMKEAMIAMGFDKKTRIETVGIPRFDFYRPPWSHLFLEHERPAGARSRVLFCTNFAFADYHGAPEVAEVFFASLKDRLPVFKNYQELIEVHYQNRRRIFDFLTALARAKKWELIVRPHPYEKIDAYRAWHEQLPPDQRADVKLDKETNITPLILNSALQISCETCTTALEGWIARKPTIELTFQRHPVFFHAEHAALQPLCAQPAEIAALVEKELQQPDQATYHPGRMAHLEKWCHTVDGKSGELVAEVIAGAVKDRPAPDWSQLTLEDRRRGMKLKLLRRFNLPYHFDPWLAIKGKLRPKKYALKQFVLQKSIRPSDVTQARQWIEAAVVHAAAPPNGS